MNEQFHFMNPDDIKHEFDEAQKHAENLQNKFAKATKSLGQVSSVIETTKPYWVQLAVEGNNHIGSEVILNSGVESIHQIKNALVELDAYAPFPLQNVNTIALSASAFGSNTAATGSLFVLHDTSQFDVQAIPIPEISEESCLADRFSGLDPALGKVCAQIFESLYGTVSDPERAAFFMIRQTWDHLFDKLAPDAEVRDSQFWKKKAGDKPDQVTRAERIEFAVDRHIKDPVRKNLLLTSSKQMCDIYQELNRAHERGEIDRNKAKRTLNAMYQWLIQWADGIGI
jgi:hypothetical protein